VQSARVLKLLLLAMPPFVTGCRTLQQEETFSHSLTLAGQEVAPEVLNHGREQFVQNCAACHGLTGDGTGPAARYYRPPPRDLTAGLYKFGGVVDGLPHDADFARILRRGLNGTPMLPWDIPDADLYPLIQYVKSLAPAWRARAGQEEAGLGTRIPVDTDPWQGRRAEAISRGRKNYHGLASCQQCHPAYLTQQEMLELAQEVGNPSLAEFRLSPFQPVAKESQYTADGNKLRILPPDFLFNPVRSGTDPTDLYRIISSGIPGTAMPTWYNALPASDIWAIAYYVQSLTEMQGTSEGFALRATLDAQ
jgi:mono/diheme cytochrome c family protein